MSFIVNRKKKTVTFTISKDKYAIFAHVNTNSVNTNGFKNIYLHYHHAKRLYYPCIYLIWGSRDLQTCCHH